MKAMNFRDETEHFEFELIQIGTIISSAPPNISPESANYRHFAVKCNLQETVRPQIWQGEVTY